MIPQEPHTCCVPAATVSILPPPPVPQLRNRKKENAHVQSIVNILQFEFVHAFSPACATSLCCLCFYAEYSNERYPSINYDNCKSC